MCHVGPSPLLSYPRQRHPNQAGPEDHFHEASIGIALFFHRVTYPGPVFARWEEYIIPRPPPQLYLLPLPTTRRTSEPDTILDTYPLTRQTVLFLIPFSHILPFVPHDLTLSAKDGSQ